MKRLLFSILLGIWAVPEGFATTNYINNGVVSVISPPQIIPSIDASNFVNNGTFYITNFNSTTQFQPPPPYESWNTRNWTNSNRMAGDSGFLFDYFDSVGQTNGWSANFQNAGSINETNCLIFGADYLLINSTNVFNKGTLVVGGAGLLAINGKAVDITRGALGVVGNESNTLAGIQDVAWGVETVDSAPFFGPSSVFIALMEVTTIEQPLGQPPQYVQGPLFLNFNDNFTAHIRTNDFGTFRTVDAVFLRNTNPAVSTEVRFSASTPSIKTIQWSALQTNRVNGVVTTNLLYLQDSFSQYPAPFLLQRPYPVPIYQFLAAATYYPANYALTHSAPFGYLNATVIPPGPYDPTLFQGTNATLFSTNAGYIANVTAAAFPPNPTIQGSTWSNTLGRIELTATGPGSSLNLTRTRADGESYLLLKATNHFVGSTNAVIISPISDIYLRSSNGLMSVSNLTTPFVPRMQGQIGVQSVRWTNAAPDGVLTIYNVTFVESVLEGATKSQIQNLTLQSTNLLIGDALNVFGNLLLDTVRLTVSTNAYNAPTAQGELNLTSGELLWAQGLPTLQYLTNFGRITSANSIFFGGSRTPPFFNGTFTEAYKAFVNHGYLESQGNTTWANYYEFSDTNISGIGPISVQANVAYITNGAFIASDADIAITSGSLLVSNQVLQAGRSITLTATNYLDDGSLGTNVAAIAYPNFWSVGGGFNLLLLPTNASLLGTTVTNSAFANAEVDNYWAGKDYGSYPRGFVSNAAVGHLVLNGDSGSLFAFLRTGLTNAIYVDLLELGGATTNADDAGNFAGVYIQTNFTIYYGDAIAAGHSIAEKLNRKFGISGNSGGRFIWVSNYNSGYFSSTNITYTDGSVHSLNRALVYSCDINSNGQPFPPTGGANATCDGAVLKPDPIPVLTPATLKLTAKYTNSPSKSVILSWNTIPNSCNYLFAASSPAATGTNWQLVTNFISADVINGQATVKELIRTNPPKYYRVNATSP